MKLQASDLPFSKSSQTRRKSPKLIPLIALTFLLTILPIYYPFYRTKPSLSSQLRYQHDPNAVDSASPPNPSNPSWLQPPALSDNSTSEQNAEEQNCDLFDGEWIPNPDGPYYTSETCGAIQEHQNCMKFGRPDTEYLKWRWKPDGCELPIFDPSKFLEMVRGKSIVFVGDSVARNHMQSLICLLSRVAEPLDASKPTDENRLYQYTHYNFNISIISSPYLVHTHKSDPNDFSRPYHLYLDEFDLTWTSKLQESDYLIISAGQWFFRPSYFYLNRTLVGCLYCSEPNVTHLPSSFSYRWAFQTAFRAINAAAGFSGVTFVRTYAPSHFEGGPWDKGGDCTRRKPFRRNETAMEDYALEMYRIQVEEVGNAGKMVRLFDATKAMMLRADGHPSKYGRPAGVNQTFPNDCVHWCLPGPIDSWNDFLQELLRREFKGYYSKLGRPQ